ncbi:MAG TPA: SMC family ATPase [Marmoricola sp.]|jgi:exonuclease SbcC|nr:SMC family ATPase [Marmoricola sp.]
MRLHQLAIRAFGPFAETVEVDFDELSTAGLFLLTGATGAGKSSILDAVCFALYGQVPGDRAGAKHLRSDHAAPHVAPEVVLRLSIGERQLSFTRSPAWARAKMRGSGETRVQAHVLVEEFRDGAWMTLTNRLDDAGLLVSDLLGMTCAQFNQVAMLPQGRFQAFLRATSAERHSLLQQLFRTDRFERIEQWLVERRVALRRSSEAVADTVLETVNRVREAMAADEDPAWLDDLGAAADSGDVERWLCAVTAAAANEESAAARISQDADSGLATAQREFVAAERSHDLLARAARAQADLSSVEARTEELEVDRQQLADHRRAATLGGLATAATASRRSAAEAAQAWEATSSGLAGLVLGSRPSDLPTAQRDAQDALALAIAFGPRAEAHKREQQRLSSVQSRLQSVEAGIAETEVLLADQPGVIAEAAAAVHEARAAAARHPAVLARSASLEASLRAARRAELLGLELAVARTDVLTATESAQQARERYLDLREARINGMAGELAGQLASGCSCPVCGSADHPSPASASSTGVGRLHEDAARKAQEDAEFDLQARQVGLGTLEGELASLDERLSGVDRDALPGDLEAAQDEAERLEPLVAALEVLVAREASCRSALAVAEKSYQQALLERAALATELDEVAAALDAIEDAWAALLGVRGAAPGEQHASTLADIIRLRTRLARTLAGAVADHEAWQSATARAQDIAGQVEQAAVSAGFATFADATAALLDDDARIRIEAVLDDAELTMRAARLTLADPEVGVALERPASDLAACALAHTAAAALARTAIAALVAARARSSRLNTLSTQLEDRLAGWAPIRERHRTVAALASLVEGKSVDNPLKMRLAAYVLSERLRQVVEAANERLAGMTDQRYVLEHSDDRGFGEQRGGLSLRVRDAWSGVLRDPATLSGGETFVVSLALALGLADTVAHEAGGTDIDTLFIDEGFGSLDADTLEDVMDTLDSLRDGGRVVGLVSHVPELRSRISTQLEVVKGRTGSTVRTAVGAG